MDFNDYFSPVSYNIEHFRSLTKYQSRIFNCITLHTEDNPVKNIENYKIAIFGVEEDRGSKNFGSAGSPGKIREAFYELFSPSHFLNIIDLGTFKTGIKIEDTYIGLTDVCKELISRNIVPVIIGGGFNLAYSVYNAYEELQRKTSVLSVNSGLDIGDKIAPLNSENVLSKLIIKKSNHLFNYTNIAFQGYLVANEDIETMHKMYFDAVRLGTVRDNIKDTEPYFRDANAVFFNTSAVRKSDSPGNLFASPNGLYSEEICQLARYAGLSDKVSSFGIFEANISSDRDNQTAQLVAQIIWFFIEGFFYRKNETILADLEKHTKFLVRFEGLKDELVFYRSNKTNRWWMEVIHPKTTEKFLVACSLEDYQKTCRQELPERWWKFFQKIS